MANHPNRKLPTSVVFCDGYDAAFAYLSEHVYTTHDGMFGTEYYLTVHELSHVNPGGYVWFVPDRMGNRRQVCYGGRRMGGTLTWASRDKALEQLRRDIDTRAKGIKTRAEFTATVDRMRDAADRSRILREAMEASTCH